MLCVSLISKRSKCEGTPRSNLDPSTLRLRSKRGRRDILVAWRNSGKHRLLINTRSSVRSNQDRPLDCWKEVETFKSEVAKLEQVSLCPKHCAYRINTSADWEGFCQIITIDTYICRSAEPFHRASPRSQLQIFSSSRPGYFG